MNMHKVSLANKVFTENPLLDEIVYNARQLATGVVVKDPDLADAGETLESLQAGDILISIRNGNIQFNNFDYDEELLSKYYTDPYTISRFARDNSLIPEEDKPYILDIAVKIFLESYVEENPYYRMLHGLPNYKYDSQSGRVVWKGLYVNPESINDITPIGFNNISYYEKDGFELIQDLSLVQKNLLFENGTCEAILENTNWLASYDLTPADVRYVMHIGDREIDYYDARVADKFALLYCPKSDAEEVRARFKDLYEANRLYMLYTSYQEAYKYRSDYYNNFIMIFLIIQTVIDMVVELPEYIIRRDIFDTRTCKYIFESNGVKYFKDIPLKYQVALVKNLNKLIKFKSTDKCIVDIVSLFGTENIEVFRYYIMKDRRVNDEDIKNLEYYDNTKTTVSTSGVTKVESDNDKNYDIRFIKVPMLGNYDDHIRTDSKIRSYETMTDGDATWQGDKYYEDVHQAVKDLDFTVLRSKYYSIEAVIDLAKRNFTVIYFMNILMYNNVDCSKLLVNLPNISNTKRFELIDVILALYSLSYIYYGVEDTILDSRSKAAQIMGFNPEVDLGKISTWLADTNQVLKVGYDAIDYEKKRDVYNPFRSMYLAVNNENSKMKIKLCGNGQDYKAVFSVPEDGKIMSFNALEDLFMGNKDCYDHIISVLNDPPSKEIYDVYKYLYKALLTTNRNMEYFLVGDNHVVDDYKKQGFKTKFVTIPRAEDYHEQKDFDQDMKWLLESIDEKTLCFDMDKDFDENHKFDLYVKENDELKNVGSAQMAYTYKEFLRYKDIKLYSFIATIVAIPNAEQRSEACINAIQSITSYLKDYIDRDVVELDTVLSGLPSISLDFIKRYVEEVIDFFKSFKIFTHGSSIIYSITDRFENYVHLVDHALMKLLFDKSELVRIEDAFGGKIENLGDLLVHQGNGVTSNLTSKEKIDMVDKVWFEINTWISKNYDEFFNSTVYQQADQRIRDWHERFSTLEFNDYAYHEHPSITEDEDVPSIEFITDGIVRVLVSLTLGKWVDEDGNEHRCDILISDENIGVSHNYILKTQYDQWIADIASIMVSKEVSDRINYQDDYLRSDFYDLYSVYSMTDGTAGNSISIGAGSRVNFYDTLDTIITQEFPPHEFDE